ncbi:hypothetical protein P389DRAFT_198639 [Cystobasidium minutum MCA 4210]|uniref:uncharacterized protein n=1 Tax=Cystobasidium minutum MCA 4210 TaxID=1397322 RepID=UPI0034CDB033|eukprot:jgi/Rhomi1/198639/gm1.6853_g
MSNPSAPAMSALPSAASSTSTSTAIMAGHKDDQDLSKIDISSPHELTAFVDDVLTRLEATFDNMSSQVLERLETISKRIDTVELSISDLMQGNTLQEAAEAAGTAAPAKSEQAS